MAAPLLLRSLALAPLLVLAPPPHPAAEPGVPALLPALTRIPRSDWCNVRDFGAVGDGVVEGSRGGAVLRGAAPSAHGQSEVRRPAIRMRWSRPRSHPRLNEVE